MVTYHRRNVMFQFATVSFRHYSQTSHFVFLYLVCQGREPCSGDGQFENIFTVKQINQDNLSQCFDVDKLSCLIVDACISLLSSNNSFSLLLPLLLSEFECLARNLGGSQLSRFELETERAWTPVWSTRRSRSTRSIAWDRSWSAVVLA